MDHSCREVRGTVGRTEDHYRPAGSHIFIFAAFAFGFSIFDSAG